MKVPLLKNAPNRFPGLLQKQGALLFFALLFFSTGIWAEGSKDFITYPGYRMFLDTRDSQQLKVYANNGEFINVGASHVGLQGGFIRVYNPNGVLVQTYDNTGPNTGLAIINNSTQEMNGPTGSANSGYNPGVVAVGTNGGVWTVVFDYPDYVIAPFTNIMNNASWTRVNDQPNTQRVVLAWDITVTANAAGNNNGVVKEGRVYSNEHISLINGNGFETSPTFYVLTQDGYLYQVNVNNADPFRFPISSNSLGLVNGNMVPIYKSKAEANFTRSDDTTGWVANQFYLYEPQAEDLGGLINNKVFFNVPDPTMPTGATVTDIFRDNTHQTWLSNNLEVLTLDTTYLLGANPGGAPCNPGAIQFGKGAWLYIETNLGGSVTLQLDLNNNGLYDDPVDVTIMGVVSDGLDSIFWDGKDGLGNFIPVGNDFQFNVIGKIRFGEIHIALTDVENNSGGVTFSWLNAPAGFPTDLFYFDHSEIGGPISGGVATPPALPVTIPFTYTGQFGNDKYLDQWSFIEFEVDTLMFNVNVVVNCVCEDNIAVLALVSGSGSLCVGDALSISATNSTVGTGDLTYTWSGPAGFSFTETIAEGDTSTASVGILALANAGIYTVVAQNAEGCGDTLSVSVLVNDLPVAAAILGGGSFCAGDDVVLTSSQLNLGLGGFTYTFSGPNGFTDSGTATGVGSITTTINDISLAGAGAYSLTIVSDSGCVSVPVSANIVVQATPVLQQASGAGSYCVGDNATLVAINSAGGTGNMTCTWTGPNGFFSQTTVSVSDTLTIDLTNLDLTLAGNYVLNCSTPAGCVSAPLTFVVEVNNTPEINNATPNGGFCEGASITLTAENVNPGTGPITYTWTGPNGFTFTGTGPALGPFPAVIDSLTLAHAGTYTLVLATAGGCESVPQSVTIEVFATPVIADLTPSGDYCLGQDIVLTGTNITSGITSVIYTWSGPNGFFEQGVGTGTGPYVETIVNAGPADAGIYTLVLQSDNSCTSDPATVTVNIVQGLTLTDVTADGAACEGDDLTLTGSSTTFGSTATYTWTGPNGFNFSGSAPSEGPFTVTVSGISAASEGVYTLSVETASGCLADTTVNITVAESIMITNITGSGPYCEGADIVLCANGDGDTATVVTYTWTGPNGFSFTGTGDGDGPFCAEIPSATIVNAGLYTLNLVTDLGCASDPISINVEIFAVPIITNLIPGDTIFCEGDTVTLCGENGAIGLASLEYTWTAPNGQIFNGTGAGDDIFCVTYEPIGPNGAGAYTLVLSNNGCTSDPDSIVIELNPDPEISQIQGSGTYCEGDTVVLSFWNTQAGIDSMFYTCNFPGGVQITGVAAGTDTIFITMTEPGFVCCSLESFDGCVSSLTCAEVIFEPVAIPVVVPTMSVCSNETLVLDGQNSATGTGTVTYMWTGPGGFMFMGTAPWGGPFPATVNDPVAGDYCLKLTSGNNCVSETACITVTVNPTPEVENNTITGGGEFCAGEDVSLSATITIADGSLISYEWTLNGNPVSSGTAASGTTITLDLANIEVSEGGEYCLNLTSTEGCEADPVCTQVTVNPTPTLLTVTGGGAYCEGVDVLLNGTGEPGLGTVTYTWVGPEGFIFTSTAPSAGPFPATVSDITLNQAGVYTLITSIGDCDSEPLSVTVDVNPMPEITNASGGGEFCPGEMTTLIFTIDPSGANSVNFVLTGPGLDSTGTITQVTTLMIDVIAGPTTAGTYSLTVTSDAGCEADPASLTISLKTPDPATLTATPNPLCPGDELQLTTNAQTGANVSYDWFLNGTLIETTTEPILNIANPTAGDYSVTANVEGCTSASASVTVGVLSAPVAVDDAFQGQTGTPITGNILGNDTPNNGDDVDITIITQPSNGTVTVDANGNMTYNANAGFSGTDEFTYEICLTECSDVCDQAVVTITVDPNECIVPNVITPNGDNVNDVLVIKCLNNPENFPNNSLRIFNRWGDEIYVSQPYLNDWDGTYGTDKKELPAATYFYLFQEDKDSDDKPKAGYIEVVR